MMICEEGRHCALCDSSCSSYVEVVPVQRYKKAISKLIFETLNYAYCDNCKFEDNDVFNFCCENCHRKAINWSVARHTCDDLAERILNEQYEILD